MIEEPTFTSDLRLLLSVLGFLGLGPKQLTGRGDITEKDAERVYQAWSRLFDAVNTQSDRPWEAHCA